MLGRYRARAKTALAVESKQRVICPGWGDYWRIPSAAMAAHLVGSGASPRHPFANETGVTEEVAPL